MENYLYLQELNQSRNETIQSFFSQRIYIR